MQPVFPPEARRFHREKSSRSAPTQNDLVARCRAPVKAPFSWPNNSEAMSEEGIAAQFTLIKAWPARCEPLWMARAISSLPVPVSPVISTVESVGATFTMLRKDSFQGGRGSHDLFKHEDLINLLPQDHILVMKAVFQPFDFFESLP